MSSNYPRKIIFDMDGVVTSEECYWNTAALVNWELLFSRRGLGIPVNPGLPPFEPAPGPARVTTVRRVIFQDDRVITCFKRRAVNSNWDLAFYTFAFQLVHFLNRNYAGRPQVVKHLLAGNPLGVEHLPQLGSRLAGSGKDAWRPSFAAVTEGWCGTAGGAELGAKLHALLCTESLAAAIPPDNFKPASLLWEGVRRIFQEWYLGEEGYKDLYGELPAVPGKRGFMAEEKPLLPVEKVKETLEMLQKRGWILGIATGRPGNELLPPLQQMGFWSYFDHASVITFDRVEQAQQAMVEKGEPVSLGKPHPFSLLKAYWKDDRSPQELIFPPFPSPPAGKCYLVGDAPADLLTARAGGVSFIAVLTGHEGAAARSYFVEQGANAVLPDMTQIPAFLDRML